MKNIAWFVGSTILVVLVAACNYTLSVKDGQTAYSLKRYADAVPMLEKEFNKAKSRAEKGRLAYLLGESFSHNGQPEPALNWYKIAYDNSFGPDALRGYAFTLKKMERYADAKNSFKDLGIEIGSPYEYRKEVIACDIAADWKNKAGQTGYTISPAGFNSPQNDFAPTWSTDGRIVFTSDRSAAAGKEKYGWTDNAFMDIFVVEKTGASAQIFDTGLNTDGHEGTPCFNQNGTEIFYVKTIGAYKGDNQYCKIFTAQRVSGTWTTPVPLPFQKEKINYLHPCLSADGNTLFFSCNDAEGWGGYDIYTITRKPNSETGWTDPKLLTRNINTPGNELFPSLDADTLYFSSDGLQGMGGLDIFRTYKTDKTNWAPPINLKSPIKSGADKLGFIVDPTSVNQRKNLQTGDLIRSGFFTSNRSNPEARGLDDIYQFEQRVPPPPPVVVDTTPSVPLVYKIIIEGYVLEKIFSTADDPNSRVLGRRPLDGAKVEINDGKQRKQISVGADGFFRIEAAENTDYAFSASKNEYLNNSTRFSTKGMAKNPSNPIQTFEVEVVLDRIYRDREIVLENIYYDFNKWDIRPDAEPTLNTLAETLRQNPTIGIQLGSHTDCRGNDDYNQTLSQRRAESAVNYLVSKGISADRLRAIGYGESNPADNCACSRCTETEHQANRRTTFRVE